MTVFNFGEGDGEEEREKHHRLDETRPVLEPADYPGVDDEESDGVDGKDRLFAVVEPVL